ncbi:MAG: aminodeoxychorismate synthase component I [Proteobacteria bacterium]|nr:aminodeoxychorismate synthase component I [Pseudomonadota bacterium]
MDDELTLSEPRAVPVAYWHDTAARVHRLSQHPWFVLLDSCRFCDTAGRYDIVAWDPVTTFVTEGEVTQIFENGRLSESAADPFGLVRDRLGRETRHSEFPFTGGAIGYFGYDLSRRIERLPATAVRDIQIPDMAVGIYDRFLLVDHDEGRAWFIHRGLQEAEVRDALARLEIPRTVTPAAFSTRFIVTSSVRRDMSYLQYAAAFRRIKRYIRDGDCYQVNFAQRFSALAEGDPWDAYLRLRNLNAAPYAAFLKIPGAAVLSSSPERFLRVTGDEVETKPIKGTRPRSCNPVDDRRLAVELSQSAKDRAENLMIVDLLRNDMGKTCVFGTIEVPELFAVESFARVHHLVSTVRGRLQDGLHALDVLRGCFPGGSITGAPKLRAMEIIEELEPTRRGIYCGAIGYISHDGQMDTNIAIRTLLHHRERLYCWAGGGIVIDSELDGEYQESLDKAAAMLNLFADAEIENMGR